MVRRKLESGTAPPVVYGRLLRRRGGAFFLWEGRCPYCDRFHVHGAGRDGKTLGHRVPHCLPGDLPKGVSKRSVDKRGYVLALSRKTPERKV